MLDTPTSQTHQSKWGYHPCDLDTFKLLREIYKRLVQESFYVARWGSARRKEKQNRKAKQEPKLEKPPFFILTEHFRRAGKMRYLDKTTESGLTDAFVPFGYDCETGDARFLCQHAEKIVEAYKLARTPSPEPPTKLIDSKIVLNLYAQMQEGKADPESLVENIKKIFLG